jgi:hypothetical protein
MLKQYSIVLSRMKECLLGILIERVVFHNVSMIPPYCLAFFGDIVSIARNKPIRIAFTKFAHEASCECGAVRNACRNVFETDGW